jgi:hypothetical protein
MKLSPAVFILLLIGSISIISTTWLVSRYWLRPPETNSSQLSPDTSPPQPSLTSLESTPAKTTPSKPQNPPLPQGKTPFSVSSGKKDGPQFSQGFIDPYDPAVGQSQSITISLNDPVGISSVSVIVQTDKQTETYPMHRTTGTDVRGEWSGQWTVRDTHLVTYNATLVAKNAKDIQNKIEMTLR